MRKIKLIVVGSVSSEFKQISQHYEKRVAQYSNFSIIEVKEQSNEKNSEVKKLKETNSIIEHIDKSSFVVLCSLQGKQIDSVQLSQYVDSNQDLTFIIGGSDGMQEDLIPHNLKICFSKMTFPHQLFRVMLLEQIYRANTILANKKYHK
ncbi:23S rRNA (pseudouridine(1915)-N(3))-methyltransferase RlmH [Mycoplasma simbae]|uniref:23S rRNA (pseudouridine(1915)-N(3))-methyltransferase RlmH n=1 Tax=Mycoplasma simbae TaxID=36744 RepID=UPI0004956999|nr:23S rRNA (pseudouridine(1915)-N(3))-methyltransferase RlmH [Mycoplasma simbae]